MDNVIVFVLVSALIVGGIAFYVRKNKKKRTNGSGGGNIDPRPPTQQK